MIIDEYKHAKWINYKMASDSSCSSCSQKSTCKNYACPLVHNYSDNNVNCGREYFNIDKILDLLTNNDRNDFVKKY
jgi:hypothetical protein